MFFAFSLYEFSGGWFHCTVCNGLLFFSSVSWYALYVTNSDWIIFWNLINDTVNFYFGNIFLQTIFSSPIIQSAFQRKWWNILWKLFHWILHGWNSMSICIEFFSTSYCLSKTCLEIIVLLEQAYKDKCFGELDDL